MKKCTVGIDAHKESNVLGLTFNDIKPAIVHGKLSADLNRTVDAIRKILGRSAAHKNRSQFPRTSLVSLYCSIKV